MFATSFNNQEEKQNRPRLKSPFAYYAETKAKTGEFELRSIDEDGEPVKHRMKTAPIIAMDILFAVRKKDINGNECFSQWFRRCDEPVKFFTREKGESKTTVLFDGKPTSYTDAKKTVKAENGQLNILVIGLTRKTGKPVILNFNGYSFAEFTDAFEEGGINLKETPVLILDYVNGTTRINPLDKTSNLYFPGLTGEALTAADKKVIDTDTVNEVLAYIKYKRPDGADSPKVDEPATEPATEPAEDIPADSPTDSENGPDFPTVGEGSDDLNGTEDVPF